MGFFTDIDWKLLRLQKETLIATINFSGGKTDHLDGILHLIDQLQEAAIDEFGVLEEDVFGDDTSLKFVCPKCKGHRLEEIMSNVSVASEITEIKKDGDLNYGEQTNEDGEVAQYQCINCGFFVGESEGYPITDCVELAEWVAKNCS
jgi:hypothetical protein